MKLDPLCIGCLFNQILKALNLLAPTLSKEEKIRAQQKLMEFLIKLDPNDASSPLAGKEVYSIVAKTLKVKDPYKDLKKKYNDLALEYYDKVKKIIEKSQDPLLEAIIVSALGNTLDPASQHEIDLINDIKNFKIKNLIINDYPEFKKSLDKATQILIILDNCGEIVFDKLLVLTLKKLYPQLEIICSVRGGPVINDATMEDAIYIGLTDNATVIEAPATPGILLSQASEEFKRYFFDEKGIVLSKGQGNFEGLYQVEIPKNVDVFYLLKAKCALMEEIFNVKINDLIFKKKRNDF